MYAVGTKKGAGMSIIQSKATEVAMNVAPDNPDGPSEVFIDPATIILIGQIIVGVIKMYQQCRQKQRRGGLQHAGSGLAHPTEAVASGQGESSRRPEP
jgi:hypothetical protein